jgi:hypothetical protein
MRSPSSSAGSALLTGESPAEAHGRSRDVLCLGVGPFRGYFGPVLNDGVGECRVCGKAEAAAGAAGGGRGAGVEGRGRCCGVPRTRLHSRVRYSGREAAAARVLQAPRAGKLRLNGKALAARSSITRALFQGHAFMSATISWSIMEGVVERPVLTTSGGNCEIEQDS